MNFEPVHIHKTHKHSMENMVFLVIPILLFTLIIGYFLYLEIPVKLSLSEEQTSVLGETVQNP